VVAPIVAFPRANDASATSRADEDAQLESLQIRSQLARELHDEVVQTLTSVLMQTRVFAREQQENRVAVQQFAYVHDSVREVLNNLRHILSDLRGQPGFDGDLVAALRERLLPRFENTPMTVTLRVGRSWPAHIPPESGTQLYRIIQEALTNAYRHGGASSAEVDLKTTENQVVCAVRDNGRGIAWLDDSKPLGMGILGMKERAALLGGDVTIRNRPRGGTAVIAAFDKEGLLCRSKRKRSAS